MAAHTLEKLAALIWLLGSVSPCKPCSAGCSVWPEGTQLPPKEESLMVPLVGFEVPRAVVQPD